MLDAGQVEAIRASTKTLAELATEYEVSTLTLGKVKRRQGAYVQEVLPLGFEGPAPADLTQRETFIPFDPPVQHE
jgi:hypothetical protein